MDHEKKLRSAFATGYACGHNDTVESAYADPDERAQDWMKEPGQPVGSLTCYTAERLAEFFHSTYERVAPAFGYKTRKRTRVPWKNVDQKNKALMVTVCRTVLDELRGAV